MEQTFWKHPEKRKDANNIVIVGGGVVGCETAHWLANEYGRTLRFWNAASFMMGSVQQTETFASLSGKSGCGCITVQR